jgi:hypothetical protein
LSRLISVKVLRQDEGEWLMALILKGESAAVGVTAALRGARRFGPSAEPVRSIVAWGSRPLCTIMDTIFVHIPDYPPITRPCLGG